MRDCVFLFGAGASFGAGGILPEQPPLGAQLHAELARLYPGSWGALPDNIRSALVFSFEGGMELIHQSLGGAIPQLMREMAIYFVQFRAVSEGCLYRRLVKDLDSIQLLDRIAFSALNYDCVLDLEVVAAGHQVNYFDEAGPGQLPLWKLHGSCNMFCEGIQATQGVTYGTGVTFEGGVQAWLDSNRVIQHCLVETSLAPVMCLYMRGKPLNISPAAIQAVQAAWTKAIDEARLIVVIGARPWPEDEHIWNPLRVATAELLFVGSQAEASAWAATRRNGATAILGPRWADCYDPLMQRIQTYAT